MYKPPRIPCFHFLRRSKERPAAGSHLCLMCPHEPVTTTSTPHPPPPPPTIYLHSIPLEGKIQNRTSGAWSPNSLHTSEAEAWIIKVKKKGGVLKKHGALVDISLTLALTIASIFSAFILLFWFHTKNHSLLGSSSAWCVAWSDLWSVITAFYDRPDTTDIEKH